ncbi:hypothetical protein KAI65_06025 [Candidatus Parcubacteria bacterium]|nr:hypothetical protein [Candidatus Parcubacteria bacterium]
MELLTVAGRHCSLAEIKKRDKDDYINEYTVYLGFFYSPKLGVPLGDEHVIVQCIEQKIDIAKALSISKEEKPLLTIISRRRLMAERKRQTGKDDYDPCETGFFWGTMGMGLYDEHVVKECVEAGIDVAKALVARLPDEPKNIFHPLDKSMITILYSGGLEEEVRSALKEAPITFISEIIIQHNPAEVPLIQVEGEKRDKVGIILGLLKATIKHNQHIVYASKRQPKIL